MLKPRINAADALADIREGMPDTQIMEKYGLSARGLQSLFGKLKTARLITEEELDRRASLSERTVDLTVFRCPACNMPQFQEFKECPQCGIIVSRYKDMQKPARVKKRIESQTVHVGQYRMIVSPGGTRLTIEGLNEELQRKLVDRVRKLLIKHATSGGR